VSDAARRRTVTFPSSGERCGAWLDLPAGASPDHPVPVIVMAHGLGAIKELRLSAFAERFVGAGYACLVFDYRHFGESDGAPRQLLSIRRQRADWRAAIAFARSLPELDPNRVVAWGTSFAGGHVVATAAEDPRLAAAIAQCPFTDGLSSALRIAPRTSAALTLAAARDLAARLRGRDPVRVKVAGYPGEKALMNATDVREGVLALIDASGLTEDDVPQEVPARIALAIPFARPGRRAKDVRCPTLFCVCDADTVAPARATLRHAAKAPHGDVRRYPYGHFDIYVGDPFERVVSDQLAFLAAHVPVAAAARAGA